MHLNQLSLHNFKNYAAQNIDFSPTMNCLTGLNGMGKTNVLDAIYYLCMCKSHFSTNDALLVLQGEDFFRLEGHFQLKNQAKVVAKIVPRKRKEFEFNGAVYDKLSEHIGKIPVVMISPDETALATEGSEERRRLMDNSLAQLDQVYLNQLMIYNKVLEQRNALLKQFSQQNNFNESLLEVYDQQLLAPAETIFSLRKIFIQHLTPIFQEYYKIISDDREHPDCQYVSQLTDANFSELLKKSRDKDRILARSNVGIHKDELSFSFDGNPLKKFASQGQLKSFVLALKLAQYEVIKQRKGTKPILLLDDIFDRLDAERVSQLLELLAKKDFGQIFITDTQGDRMAQVIAKHFENFNHFEVENAKITLVL
jgi:DNA replication and repair protein RecF